MRVIGQLPPELTRLLFDLGPRKLVLVEGTDDRAVFREWYQDRLSEVEFFTPESPQGGGGGERSVTSLLAKVLAQSTSPDPREYGIIDRDFREIGEVEAPPQRNMFILRRYALENYMLEPAVVAEEVRVLSLSDDVALDSAAMEAALLGFCQQLRSMMAANWLCSEAQTKMCFPEGHEIFGRDKVLAKLIESHNLPPADANERLAEKETLIDPLLSSLQTAHTRINGKHLLFQVRKAYIKSGSGKNSKEQFRNLLARAVKRAGLHEDIKAIMERILP